MGRASPRAALGLFPQGLGELPHMPRACAARACADVRRRSTPARGAGTSPGVVARREAGSDNGLVMRSPDGNMPGPPFVVLVLIVVVLLACHAAPPSIETTTAAVDGRTSPAEGPGPVVPASDLRSEGPRVIDLDPPAGATDVDPARTTLAVTFDREMDRDGWAWVTESSETAPDIDESTWDSSLRVNTTKVRLAPGRSYVVWINSATYSYFRDTQGRTLAPLRWTFSTAAAAAPGIEPVSSHRQPAAPASP